MDCLDFNTCGLIAYYMLCPGGKLYTSQREYTGTVESEDSRAVLNLMRTCKVWREVFIAIARGEFMREIWHDVVENCTMEWLAENEHYLFLAYCPDITGEAIAYHQTYLWVNEPWRYDQRLVNLALRKMPPSISANMIPHTKSYRCLFNNECAMLRGDTLVELMLKSRSDEEAVSRVHGCLQQGVDKYKCDGGVTEKGECYCGESAYEEINEHDTIFWSHTCIKALQVCAFRGWKSAAGLICDKIIPSYTCLCGCMFILCKDEDTATEIVANIHKPPMQYSKLHYYDRVYLLHMNSCGPPFDSRSIGRIMSYDSRVEQARSAIFAHRLNLGHQNSDMLPSVWCRIAALNNSSLEDKLLSSGGQFSSLCGRFSRDILHVSLLPSGLVKASALSLRTLRVILGLLDNTGTLIPEYTSDWCPLSDPGPAMMQFMLELMSRTRMKFGRSSNKNPDWVRPEPGGKWLCECKTTPLRECMPAPWALAVLESPLCDKIMSLGYCEDVWDALATASHGTVQQRHWDILSKYAKDCCHL